MFRVKATIPKELLQKYIRQVKTGLPGTAYVNLDPQRPWPDATDRHVGEVTWTPCRATTQGKARWSAGECQPRLWQDFGAEIRHP